MKTNRRALTLILTVLTVLAVFTTFSCSGLFTSFNTNSGMGTLTIALPGSSARRDWTADDMEFYKVSVISEATGELVVPTQTADPGTFSAEIPTGTYSIIVQGINSQSSMYEDYGCPTCIGRTNSVTITKNETTTANVVMLSFSLDSESDPAVGDNCDCDIPEFDWGSGKLPVLSPVGCAFDGWYSDDTLTQKITEWPATTDWENFSYPCAYFVASGNGGGEQPLTLPTGENIFFATQSGTGSGNTPDDPMDIITAFSKLTAGSTLYLMGDITLPQSTITVSVTIIGAGGSLRKDKVSITRSAASGSVASFASGGTYTVENVIVDGSSSIQCIRNSGTLTLNDCIIQNGSADNDSGGGIYNTGTLTINGGQILSCKTVSSNGNGGGIYSEKTTTITGCLIENCSARSSGGGMYIDNSCKLTMSNTTINICSANRGGGISINCSSRTMSYPVSFTNCKITGCTGTSGQASIYASSSNPGNLGSNDDLTSADAWDTAISGMQFTNGQAAVTYSDN